MSACPKIHVQSIELSVKALVFTKSCFSGSLDLLNLCIAESLDLLNLF